jgi:Fic family protein
MAKAAAEAKQPYALLSLYEKLYSDKYNKSPRINKFKEKWAMADVIESVGYERSRELLEYYFSVSKQGHPLTWFLYNFDRLDDMLIQSREDAIKRKKMREATKRMVEEQA